MPETPDRDQSAEATPPEGSPIQPDPIKSDGSLRVFSEHLGIDYDAVVERAQKWVAENPLPADLGPEPFNVGKPRPPVD